MKIGPSYATRLDRMVEAGELTPEQAAEAWRDDHADDDHDRERDDE
jgi:hypothetical protein